MIIETAIASETQNRLIQQRELYSKGRREGPAERSGAANKSLFWFVELDHGSCPDARVTCIRHDHGVVGQKLGDLLADPFRSHWHGVRTTMGRHFRTPFANIAPNAIKPFLSGFRRSRCFDKLPQCYFGVSHETDDIRIIFP